MKKETRPCRECRDRDAETVPVGIFCTECRLKKAEDYRNREESRLTPFVI